jgi:monovalent cation:H+ antiporter-2, CPA2 family
VLGLSLSVASTVVLLKALESRNALMTPNGRIAVGWLIVEDLAMVLALVEVLGGAAGPGAQTPADQGVLLSLGTTLARVSAFVAVAQIVGPRVLPWLLREVARTGSRELFTLAVLAQIGELSFILGRLGLAYGLLEAEGFNPILAGALFSITLTPRCPPARTG